MKLEFLLGHTTLALPNLEERHHRQKEREVMKAKGKFACSPFCSRKAKSVLIYEYTIGISVVGTQV